MAPRTGNNRDVAILKEPTSVKDEILGYVDGFAQFGTWRVSLKDIPLVKSEQDANVLHVLEGNFRQDVWDRFFGGKEIQIEIRGLTLKVLELVRPNPKDNVLQAQCARKKSTATTAA